MTIQNLTAAQAREKLGAKQTELGTIFAEAKSDSGGYDFSKVTSVTGIKGNAVAIADRVKSLNAEADELAQHAETLEAAESAAKSYADREAPQRRFGLPGAGGAKGADRTEAKSLGQRVAGEKSYQSWAKGGAGGGISLTYDDLWPSDMLAKGAAFDTLGSKALMSRAAGFAPESIRAPGFVEAATRPIQLLDIIPMFQTDQATYKYMEETLRQHGAGSRGEGADYAESAFAFTERNSPVMKITDSLPVTDEQLTDVPSMNGYIDSRLTFGVRQKLDALTVIGDGADPNLRGLKNVAGIQSQAADPTAPMDAFYKSMTKVRLGGRATPTHHVMHPNDWQNIRLTRTIDGIYIFGSPTDAGPERLWGLPVVQQDADDQGRGYTGSFLPMFVSMFERQGVDIQIGYVGTQFAQGKRTVRADMRAALVWFRPAAFCEVTGLPE